MYAFALGIDLVRSLQPGVPVEILNRAHWALLFLPALFWTEAIIQWIPESDSGRAGLVKFWTWIRFPAGGSAILLVLASDWLWSRDQASLTAAGFALFGLIQILPAAAVFRIYRLVRRRPDRLGAGLLMAASLFFALGAALLIIRLDWLSHTTGVLALSVDLAILGLIIAKFDTFEQGENLGPDLARSLAISTAMVFAFSGQVGLAMAISTGPTPAMTTLALAVAVAAIASQVFSDGIQAFLDRLVFARLPDLRRDRADFRAAASAMPRTAAMTTSDLDPDTFAKLTRAALSNYGDLPKLASSPLTQLKVIEQRITEQGQLPNTLARAATLKGLLTESILRLKPPGAMDFGTSDEWRHYNALYFPYVVGLRPYSRRQDGPEILEAAAEEALDWFRSAVPPRTLYNWQNAAAKLVAQDLMEI